MKIKILFLVNHKDDNQYSMLKYASIHKAMISRKNNKGYIFDYLHINNIVFNSSKNIILRRINKYILFPIYLLFKSLRYDLIHISDQGNAYLANFIFNKKIIITCHDMILFKLKVTKLRDKLLKKFNLLGLKKANHIIAVSKNTKKDIKKYLKKNIKISHIYQLIPHIKYINANRQVKEKYILHIGNHLYKNRYLALEFINLLIKKKITKYKLVCVGEIRNQERNYIKKNSLQKYIQFFQNISDKKIFSLYKFSSYIIITSNYEGFGVPVIETYHHKKKLLSSTNGSLKEIVIPDFKIKKYTKYGFFNLFKKLEKIENLNSKILKKSLKILNIINNKDRYLKSYDKIYLNERNIY